MKNTLQNSNEESPVWYAMYAYKKEMTAQTELDKEGIKNFIPMRYGIKERHGKKERVLVPAISNLVFVYSTKSVLSGFKLKNPYLQYIMQKAGANRKIITIPTKQMQEFISIAEKYEENITYYKPEEVNLAKGVKVRVHGGVFDGVEGTLLKVKGKRCKRIVISIPDVITIAAAYIQPELMEILS